ncbi:PucR family transcriptional regulator ligand-binding domain-containing protein [Conexibacter sp. JD483]|uniref:PucR family transcriptional regulator n=1 Tax=unclassified Conexibacter TaxID=2627773 RepID=UPI00271BDA8C|nr:MULTISPECIES: PucR family transcriptional regulator [unclassified Conexibacter]MDO8186449.1 PucR family transcriptional regulator ligand-binding domain-containing protein [Conexibacter sp. CPCC 205706]MDO8200018.1 PucR family transcriptional regulator ligand-binding domain-containing protein [Conexibacter sp. CPCC 205762]MDR9370571.1 PucR family transcriptional regulator ligand-binding domain-containing protein [Conexibacter sp. JD483]
MGSRSMLTLGDLLDEDALGLRLLVGDAADRDRPVAGAHAIDVPQPSAWIDRDWLVLTAGTMLRDDEESVGKLVRELAETGVAALAFGIEPVFDHVPETLLDAARRAGLPVVVVPAHTPFREIVERVVRASLSEDVRASQRLVAMQRYLMDALGDEQPRMAAIERVAALVRGEVALLTRDGRVDVTTGIVPAAELWEAITARPQTTLELTCKGGTWIAVPVLRRDGAVLRWVVASSGQSGSVQLTKAAVQAAVPLLTGIDRLDATRRKQDRALRAVAFQGLLAGTADPLVAAQLTELGFAPEQPVAALVAVAGRGDDDALLSAVEEALDHARLPFVALQRGGRVVLLVQADEAEVERLAHGLAGGDGEPADAPATAIGVGGHGRLHGGVERSHREAELAVEHAGGGAPVVRFDALGTTTAILGEIPLAQVGARAEPLFERLARQPAALETLTAYFDHDLNVSTTAVHLHLHPNSLRYRLSRIEEAIGAPLRTPAVIAAVYLALRAGGHGTAGDR